MAASQDWKAKLRRELPPHRGERLITQANAIEACLFDDTALKIIGESTYTTHHRFGFHRAVRASNILNDFFNPEHFQGKFIVEFGPGHYSFSLLARHLGATVVCVDLDPVFAELGEYFGFRVIQKNFHDVTLEDIGQQADGVWIKGAFNATRVANEKIVADFVETLNTILRPEGWGWVVTVNRVENQDEDPNQAEKLNYWIDVQRQAFVDRAWSAQPIDEADRKRYALSYSGSRYYFTRGLT